MVCVVSGRRATEHGLARGTGGHGVQVEGPGLFILGGQSLIAVGKPKQHLSLTFDNEAKGGGRVSARTGKAFLQGKQQAKLVPSSEGHPVGTA